MQSVQAHNSFNSLPGNPARFCRSARYLVDAHGALIPLRKQSIEVLKYLADQANTIVPKSAIQDQVWPGVVVTDDSLVQCISEIRKALGDTDRSLLQTYPRQGYLLSDKAFVPVCANTSVDKLDLLQNHQNLSKNRKFQLTYLLAVLILATTIVTSVFEFSQKPSQFEATINSHTHDSTMPFAAEWRLATLNQLVAAEPTSRISVSSRDYQEKGMPYWNNRFLWDGYYLQPNDELELPFGAIAK